MQPHRVKRGSLQWWLEELTEGRVPEVKQTASHLRSMRSMRLVQPHPSTELTDRGRRLAESREGIR